MVYAIYAYEEMYSGYHGINDFLVDEFNTKQDAINYAKNMSYKLIQDYIIDELKEDVESESELDELINEDIAFEVYKIKDNITYSSINDLNILMGKDVEDFIDKYCEEI